MSACRKPPVEKLIWHNVTPTAKHCQYWNFITEKRFSIALSGWVWYCFGMRNFYLHMTNTFASYACQVFDTDTANNADFRHETVNTLDSCHTYIHRYNMYRPVVSVTGIPVASCTGMKSPRGQTKFQQFSFMNENTGTRKHEKTLGLYSVGRLVWLLKVTRKRPKRSGQ